MQGVKEAIILLKQYGTPVFASAVAASKFAAWAGILGGIATAILWFVILKYLVLPYIQDVKADKEKEIIAEDNRLGRGVAWGCAIILALFAITFSITGVYELVSLDYQAYKLMLFK
jgi:hypothetical protein